MLVEAFREVSPGVRAIEIERPYDTERARIEIVRVTLAKASLAIVHLPERRFDAVTVDVDAVINGGFFELGYAPSGLAISGGETLSPLRRRGGSGVLVIEDDRARLVSFEDAHDMHASLALQCGPRLVEADGSIGIRSDAPERARRTAVCIRDGGRTLDLVVARRVDGASGPGLLALAEWLHAGLLEGERGCEAALNLDGGPSTGLYVRGVPAYGVLPYGPVVHALTVTSRTPR